MHVNDQVAGEKLPRGLTLFPFLDFRDALRRDEHFVNQVTHLLGLDAFQDVLAHLVFLAGKDVHDVPLIFACECLCHKSVQSSEEMDKINQDKIEESDEATQQYHRDGNDNSRVTQFLVTAEPFFLWVPRPGTFLQLDLYFAEKVFDFGDHLLSHNIQHPTSNAQRRISLYFRSEFSVRCSAFGVHSAFNTPGGTRTPNRRFWRPLLYQLSYWRICNCHSERSAAESKNLSNHQIRDVSTSLDMTTN